MNTMKAITRNRYGSPEVLRIEEIEKPTPKNDEILVKVYATTVNRTDYGILAGKPFLIRFFAGLSKPSSQVPGTDFAGEVEAIGNDVISFKVGDRVWGLNTDSLSSHAQYMTIKENQAIALIPDDLSYEEAVCGGEGAHYAYNVINKVDIKKGDKVLLNGATGAIGSSALQLLKHYRATVTAVANTKNIALVKSLGADKVYNYEEEDFTKDDEKYPFVFDAVGKSSFGKCKHLLLPKGVYISSELGPNAENLYLPLITKIRGGKKVIFPIPTNCKRSVLFINKLFEKGAFQAVIDRQYEMEGIKEAYKYVESGRKTGNVIIKYW